MHAGMNLHVRDNLDPPKLRLGRHDDFAAVNIDDDRISFSLIVTQGSQEFLRSLAGMAIEAANHLDQAAAQTAEARAGADA